MTPSLVRRGLIAAIIASVSIAGCKRGSKFNAAGCQSGDQCIADNGGLDRWFCDTTKTPPACALHPKQCGTSADCCPGQVCNAQGHYCFDKFTTCAVDAACHVQGQICKEIGVRGQGCTYEKCGTASWCSDGLNCFNNYCVGEAPCNGGCAAGKACITATNVCWTPSSTIDASCRQGCPAGKILVLTDPDNIFDSCRPDTEKCQCDSLPPIQVRDVSRHSSIAASGQFLYVTAYDGEHGDLVVHTFDKSDRTRPRKSEWLDGVPATGHIGGDINGPRGGITDPGPNVGQYSSIAASPAGDLYVAYYDVDNGDLKFTARYGGPAARWITPTTIDGSTPMGAAPSNGDVGMYASIAIDRNGIPAIAYFRRGSFDAATGAETGASTALIYAAAKKTQPLNKDDWAVVGDVDQANRPPPPCNNACKSIETCVVDENAPNNDRCATKATAQCLHTDGSAPGCTGNQTCVADTDANQPPVCRETKAAEVLAELPRGTGLMPSLAFLDDSTGSHPVIAYYDSLNKVVKAVMGSGGGTATDPSAGRRPGFQAPVEIDGHDMDPAGRQQPPQRDTGRWPALSIGPPGAAGGRIAIAFADLSRQQLLIYQSDGLTAHAAHAAPGSPGLMHVVDDGRPGVGQPWHPQSRPGAQTSISFTPGGKIALAYQDATPVDLIFATYDPTQFKTTARDTLRAPGAAGFWPRIAIVGGTAYVSSATIKAATAQIALNPLYVDATPAP
jgi:hypothetical protein